VDAFRHALIAVAQFAAAFRDRAGDLFLEVKKKDKYA